MNTARLRPLATALLLSACLCTLPAHARVAGSGATVDDEEFDVGLAAPTALVPPLDHTALDRDRFDVDLSGRETGPRARPLALGPQYPLNGHATLGGEWEPLQAPAAPGRASVDEYIFGLRIAF
jgi:hypothetical protein